MRWATPRVRQDDDVVVLRAHGLLGLRAHAVERRRHAGRALLGRVRDVERDRGELVVLDLADLADALQILVRQDRLVHLEPLLLGGALQVEDVGARPDEGDEADYELLADRIDRRVRHLREVLLESVCKSFDFDDKAEIGVSLPMEPMASWPASAMGFIKSLRLSCV